MRSPSNSVYYQIVCQLLLQFDTFHDIFFTAEQQETRGTNNRIETEPLLMLSISMISLLRLHLTVQFYIGEDFVLVLFPLSPPLHESIESNSC